MFQRVGLWTALLVLVGLDVPRTDAALGPDSPVAVTALRVADLADAFRKRAISWVAEGHYDLPTLDGDVRPDGILEAVWAKAMVVRLPYEVQQGINRPAPVETLVLLGATPQAFVAAFLCLDPHPERMRSSRVDRDRLFDDDFVGLIFDTFDDRRHAYEVFVNPVGVQADALRSETARVQEDMNFDFSWESGARRLPDGYVVEIRIPFRSIRLRVASDGQTAWRVGLVRNYPRDYRYLMFPVAVDYDRNCQICQLPVLVFSAPRASSDLVQVLPFGRTMAERLGDGPNTRGVAVGLDVKYQPSSVWTADITVRPDFSQVETDVFQVTTNLRFAPFYPEKRPFFMERSDLWSTPLQVLYTRTILDPVYGVRVTGQADRHTVAFFHLMDRRTFLWFPGVQTSSSTLLESPAFANVLRYRLDLGQQSNVGVLGIDREYAGGFNRLVSLDGRWSLSRQWLLGTQFVATWTAYPRDTARSHGQPQRDFEGWAYRVGLRREGRHWSGSFRWEALSDGFRADMGFIQQVGVQRLDLHQSWTLWPQSPAVRRLGLFTGGEFLWTSRWDRQGHEAYGGLSLEAFGQTHLEFGLTNFSERSGTAFFHGNRLWANLESRPQSWLTLRFDFGWGDAVDYVLHEKARQVRVGSGGTLKVAEGLQINYQMTYWRLGQAGMLQDAWVQYARLEWQVTPALGFRQVFQWRRYRFPDPRYRDGGLPLRERVWEAQSLVRYRWNYATALYVGFYGRWAPDGAAPRATWTAFAKFTYLFTLGG